MRRRTIPKRSATGSKLEHRRKGESFWSNLERVKKAQANGELWVIRRDGNAVAFQVGKHVPDIVCVREDVRKVGLGTVLFKAMPVRARRAAVDVMYGECAPPTSWPFRQKHGFERYSDRNMPGDFTMRLVFRTDVSAFRRRPCGQSHRLVLSRSGAI
jgi:hypothetical protein